SPYMPRILPSNVSASTVSRFLTSSGSNVPLRSRLVSSPTGPLDACTVLRVLPIRRLPSWLSSSSRCDSISPSKAASRKLFSSGANAPSLPYNDLPERNCSRAFFLISSRLNCSSFFCSITCVKVGDFSGFDTVHFTASFRLCPVRFSFNRYVVVLNCQLISKRVSVVPVVFHYLVSNFFRW